jgi:glutathione S-transferase
MGKAAAVRRGGVRPAEIEAGFGLGDKEWLENRFTIGDLIMVTVLRNLRHSGLVAEFPNLKAYQARGEARPAFQRALADQLAVFAENQPQPEGAAA